MNSTTAIAAMTMTVTQRDHGLGAGPGVPGPCGRSGRVGGRSGGWVLTAEGGSSVVALEMRLVGLTHATTRADPSPVAGDNDGTVLDCSPGARRLDPVTGPGVRARSVAPPAPIRWGLGDFAWAWPATIVGQIVIGVFVVTARGAAPHYKADAIDIAAITAGSALLTIGLLRAFVVTRGRGSLLADLGLTVRLPDWPWLAAGVLLQVVALGMVALIELVAGSEPKQEVVTAIQ